MEELHGMVVAVQQRAAYFKSWCDKVECILDGGLPEKPGQFYVPSWTIDVQCMSLLIGIEVLRGLAEEGVEKSYTEHYLQDELESAIQEVEKLNTAASQIIASKHRVR